MNDSDSRVEVTKPKKPRSTTDKKAQNDETKHLVTEAAEHQDIRKIVVQDMTRKNGSEKRTITLINERFAGNGAFGVVYQAKIAETGEIVAVKKVFQDKRYKNREFQILKILNHPNVIRMKYAFISSGEKEDEIYLNVLMDYMPENLYELLQAYIKKKQAFPNMLIKLYSYQLLRSLAYVHGLGICHRDIKPQNILVDNSSLTLKMCDFGSAKQLIEGEPNIAYICSRYYRAPELICGNANYTSAVDMWSAGCVIAELLLETPIFPGDSNSDQFIEIIKILGTPSPEQIRVMNPNMRDFNFPYIKPYSWKKVFRPEADPLLVDLISKILTYSPKRRLNPLEALLHPYFDELRSRNLQIGGKQVPNLFDFTSEELSTQPDLVHKLVPEWYSS